MTTAATERVVIPPMRMGRTIEGISAVLLPFTRDDTPDWEGFRRLLDRTWRAGLTPAVNMDTSYVNLLTADERRRALAEASEVAAGRRFVRAATTTPTAPGRRRARIRSQCDAFPLVFRHLCPHSAADEKV